MMYKASAHLRAIVAGMDSVGKIRIVATLDSGCSAAYKRKLEEAGFEIKFVIDAIIGGDIPVQQLQGLHDLSFVRFINVSHKADLL